MSIITNHPQTIVVVALTIVELGRLLCWATQKHRIRRSLNATRPQAMQVAERADLIDMADVAKLRLLHRHIDTHTSGDVA